MMSDKLPGLQILRAGAAMMVLIGHVIAEAEHYFAVPLPGDIVPWTRGVDIFFVISGFVIALSAARFTGQPAAFLWRRALRVVPLYWLFTTVMVIALITLPSGAKNTAFEPMQILTSYAFVPFERMDGRIAPVLSLGWTLNFEMFFYALVTLSLALRRPLLTSAGLLAGLAALGTLVAFQTPQLAFWSNPILIEFAFGIALGGLWLRGWHLPHRGLAVIGTSLGVILLVILDQTQLPRFLAAGVPATIIVGAGTLLCPLTRLPGMIWGDASYALYLSHRFVLRAATLVGVPLLPATQFGAFLYVAAVSALALAIGLGTHLWIEKPMLRGMGRQRSAAPA